MNTPQATLKSKFLAGVNYEVELPNAKHIDVLDEILREMGDIKIVGVGHRVVHGGEAFKESVKVDPDVVGELMNALNWLPGNPANLTEFVLPCSDSRMPSRSGLRYRVSPNDAPSRAYLYAIPHASMRASE